MVDPVLMSKGFPGVIEIERGTEARPGPVEVFPRIPESADELEEARRRKREQKRIEDSTRPLESWERYRALNDAVDEAYELIDIANREARVALIIMGALNAALFVIGTRLDIGKTIHDAAKPWMIVAFAAYAAVSLYFFIAAIDTLRPRSFRSGLRPSQDANRDHHPLGIRSYEAVALRDATSHWEAWRDLNIGQLNTELALQVHSLCLKNKAKHAALYRLYDCLRVMAVIVAALLMLLGFSAFTGSHTADTPAKVSHHAVLSSGGAA